MKPHVLSTQSATPFTTLVVHRFAHVWQSFTLLVVSTHAPPQSVGVAAGQPETHMEFWHSGVPPLHAYAEPQPPQLLLSLVKSTHAPLQSVYPLLHVKVHAPETHAAVALAMPVEHAFVQEPQSFALFAVSTQVPPQSVGVAAGQPETHADPAHTGVPPLHANDAPQPPQSLLLFAKSTHAPLQALNPLLHVKVHAPETHAAVALETPVVHA